MTDVKPLHAVMPTQGRRLNRLLLRLFALPPLPARRSHLLYYNAIVAQEDIPAFTELTYNYNYQVGQGGREG
jgi:hypothetical protein